MKKLKFFVAIFLLFILINSCNQNESVLNENLTESGLRKDFNSKKLNNLDFANLDLTVKEKLWSDKLINILNSNEITSLQRKYLLEIKQELPNLKNKKPQKLLESAISLAKITSKEDFALMFESLNDYRLIKKIKPEDFLNNQKDNYIITNLSKIHQINLELKNKPNKNARYPVTCNCEWTCSLGGVPGGCSKCEPTTAGCGFMFASPCTAAYYC